MTFTHQRPILSGKGWMSSIHYRSFCQIHHPMTFSFFTQMRWLFLLLSYFYILYNFISLSKSRKCIDQGLVVQTSKLPKLSKSEKMRFLSKGSLGVFPTQTPHKWFIWLVCIIFLLWFKPKLNWTTLCLAFQVIHLCHIAIFQITHFWAQFCVIPLYTNYVVCMHQDIPGWRYQIMTCLPTRVILNFWPKALFSQTNLPCSNQTSNKSW